MRILKGNPCIPYDQGRPDREVVMLFLFFIATFLLAPQARVLIPGVPDPGAVTKAAFNADEVCGNRPLFPGSLKERILLSTVKIGIVPRKKGAIVKTCTGSVVSRNEIVFARHCRPKGTQKYTVSYYDAASGGYKKVDAKYVTSPSNKRIDLALLYVEEPIPKQNIVPILPSGRSCDGPFRYGAGFGLSDSQSGCVKYAKYRAAQTQGAHTKLMYGDVDSKLVYRNRRLEGENSAGLCGGDSGGPVYCKIKVGGGRFEWVQAGVNNQAQGNLTPAKNKLYEKLKCSPKNVQACVDQCRLLREMLGYNNTALHDFFSEMSSKVKGGPGHSRKPSGRSRRKNPK